MKLEEARIVAHVCGDGWLGIYLEKAALQIVNGRRYHRDRNRYVIGYSNTDSELLDQFANDVSKIFNIKPRRKEKEVTVRSKRVFDRIKSLGAGKTYEWMVGHQIREAGNNVKKAWLRAFFDDEATVDVPSRRIRIKSMNMKGLKHVKNLLKDIDLKAKITGPNIDKSWYLTLNHEELYLFHKRVGFYHSKKYRKLKSLLNKKNFNKTIVKL